MEFILDKDASSCGLGAVFSQEGDDVERMVGYASQTLTMSERKYCVTLKEMLSLVWGMQQFRPYLYGRRFTARTDHNALKWLQSFHEPEGHAGGKMARVPV